MNNEESPETTDSTKLAWSTPELRSIDVRRETKGGLKSGGPEALLYRPS